MNKKKMGCPNEKCEAHKERIYFKESEYECPICGTELVYVCKKCYTRLVDGSSKLCPICEADNKDKRDQRKSKADNALGFLFNAVGLIALMSLAKEEVEKRGVDMDSIVDKAKKIKG